MNRWFPDQAVTDGSVITTAPPPVEQGQRLVPTEPFAWVGTHGGAGATSLRAATGVGLDLSGRWPNVAANEPSRVVLVGRTNTAGLDAIGAFLHEWSTSIVLGLDVVAVVVVADASSKPPKIIRERIGDLKAVVADVYQLPWVERWRETPYLSTEQTDVLATKIRSRTHPEARA